MSKHHALDDEPQSSDMSWIKGLSKPDAHPIAQTPYYSALVPRGPRHAAASDVDVDETPAVSQTAPIRRISAEQVDTLIGHLDAVGPITDEQADVGLGLLGFDEDEAADDDTRRDDDTPGAGTIPISGDAATADAISSAHAADTADTADSARPGTVAKTPLAVDQGPKGLVTPRRGRLRKPVLVGAAAALCVLTVAGGTVTSMSKGSAAAPSRTVSLVIDGAAQKISTASDSVGGALAAAGLSLTSHDIVAPALTAPIADGSRIVVQRGRLLTLTIDGRSRQVWTTATTVEQALAELGTRTSNLALSANRSRAIPLSGFAVTASTLHTVGISVAGARAKSSATTARTVGDLLAEDKIAVSALDTVTPALTTPLSDGLVISVNRVLVSTVTTTVALAEPAPKSATDPTIVRGQSKVVQAGRPGSQLIIYTVTTVNGKQTEKTEASRKTVVTPVGQVTHVGTKTTFTYVGDEVFTNDTSYGVNWDGLAMCESTHNPKAVNANPSAGLPTYGLFQFDLPTWASVGGSGNPLDASPEEQLMRAKLLYQSRGLSPWACAYAAH